jgi:hypothetical protein
MLKKTLLKKAGTITGVATIFGVALILIGLFGFISTFSPDGYLFGAFYITTALNFFHLATGIIAIWAGATQKGARLFFKIFGMVYCAIAVIGFFYFVGAFDAIDSAIALTGFFYLVLGIAFLYLGYIAHFKR